MSYFKDINIAQVTGDISTNNSTVATLLAAGVFTGTADIVTDYKSIGIYAIASHASATDGLSFQFSNDGTNWDITRNFTLAAATGKFFNIPVEAKYFRIVYTNGGTNQTYFRVQAIYHATATKESTLRLSQDVDGETAASMVRTVIAGRVNSVYRNVVLDAVTGFLISMDPFHHETHEGDSFVYTEVTDLGNGAVRDILVVTPNTTRWAHMAISIQTELEADFKFYEAPTTSNDGTSVTAYNRNRNSATTPTVTLFHTPTIAGGSEGTLIQSLHWGSGKGVGGGERGSEEWVLKQNTKYLIRITNSTSSNNQLSVILNWYEHTSTV